MGIAHRPKNPKYPMTAYMVKLAALYQNLFGEFFTTVIISPTADGQIEVQAFKSLIVR